jgi:putative restriction endonuclease
MGAAEGSHERSSLPSPATIFAASAQREPPAIRLSYRTPHTPCRSSELSDWAGGCRSRNGSRNVKPVPADDLDNWERKLEQQVANDPVIGDTERLAIIRARNGQGPFKDRVSKIESRCRITGIENPAHLVASHCKPWRDSSNEERLNDENGLLLTPSVDHLVARGSISFDNDGKLIISPVAHRPSLQRMGVDTTHAVNVGGFTGGQKEFLNFHRNAVLFQSLRS